MSHVAQHDLESLRNSPTSERRASGIPSGLLIALLLLPIVVHAAAWIATSEGQTIGRVDRAILCVWACFAVLCIVVAPRRRAAIRLIVLTYSTILALAIGELALRWADPSLQQRGPWPPIHRTAAAADTMPGIPPGSPIRISVNRLGLRGPEMKLQNARLRILCVGGSTTECLYVTDEKSWPWRLEDKLTKALGPGVFVGNAGRAGQFSLHHDYLLREYSLTPKFDWVVLLCGINDMGTLLRDNYEARRHDVPRETLPGRPAIYYRNLSLGRAVARWWQSRSPSTTEAVSQDATGAWIAEDRQKRRRALKVRTIDTLPPHLDEAMTRYSHDLRRIIGACRQRGVRLVMLTQPTLWREKMPPDLDGLLLIHTPNGAYTPGALARIMERYNQALRDVCSVDNVDCIDLANQLPKDTSVFYDDCHFNVNGCEAVADIVSRFFVEKLPKKAG